MHRKTVLERLVLYYGGLPRPMPESRCGQLTAIESDKENYGGKALVAWARAKNLGASSLDLLRIVKVRAADADARIRHRLVSGLP